MGMFIKRKLTSYPHNILAVTYASTEIKEKSTDSLSLTASIC